MELSEFMAPLSLDERTALALRAGSSYFHVRNIAFSGKVCGVLLAVELERETGGQVTRRDLRPLDWWRIWPELITEDFPVPGVAVMDRKHLPPNPTQEPSHAQ